MIVMMHPQITIPCPGAEPGQGEQRGEGGGGAAREAADAGQYPPHRRAVQGRRRARARRARLYWRAAGLALREAHRRQHRGAGMHLTHGALAT